LLKPLPSQVQGWLNVLVVAGLLLVTIPGGKGGLTRRWSLTARPQMQRLGPNSASPQEKGRAALAGGVDAVAAALAVSPRQGALSRPGS